MSNLNKKYEVGDYFLYLETGREARVIDVIDTDDYSGEFLDLEKPKWCRCSSTTMQPIATSLTPFKGETMVAADAIEEPIYTPATAPASLPDAPARPAVEPAVAVEVVPSTSKFKIGDEVFHCSRLKGTEMFAAATVLDTDSPMGIHIKFAVETSDGLTEDWAQEADLRFAEPVQDGQGVADAPAASEAFVGVPSLTVEEIITRHLNLLFKPNDRLCITLIHRTRLNSSETSALTINNLMTIEEALAPEKLKWMQEKNNEGFNVYSTMTALIPGADKRRKELTKNEYCRSVFAEVDEGGPQVYGDIVNAAEANDIPWPSIILQSSPNKFQFIWRVAGDDLSIEKIERLNEAIVQKFKCDPASTDILRLFRIPGLRNVKVEYTEKPIVEVVSVAADRRYSLDEFKLLVGEKIVTPAKPAADEEKLSKIRDSFEAAAAEVDAKIDAEPTDRDGKPRQKLNISVLKKWDDEGYLWNMNCFWGYWHDKGVDLGTNMVGLHNSGALSFTCHHGHCVERTWQDMRARMEEIVGHPLPFGDPGPEILIGGKTLAESTAIVEAKMADAAAAAVQATEEIITKAVSAQEERQQAYDKMAEECDQDTHERIDPNPYPLDAWEGTPYHLFAKIAGKDNFIPPEYLVSSLMTVTGAVCGNRISPKFSRSIDGRLYTILLSRVGSIGKGESFTWSLEVYDGACLLFRDNDKRVSKNIGAWVGNFGSARGMLERFAEQPSVLQLYPEVSTAFEKFNIPGSGCSFKDLNLDLYDSTHPLWSYIKGLKIPEDAPKVIFNSILGSTTTAKWDIMHTEYHSEDFFQRMNVVPSDEIRRVFALESPNLAPVSAAVMPRVGLLATHRMIWEWSTEAKALGEDWFHAKQNGEWGGEDMSDTFGRIQVFIHRILCHLALWLAPLPSVTKQDIDLSLDFEPTRSLMEERPWLVGEGIKTEDKMWNVTITSDMMARALRLADHQLIARLDNRPPKGSKPVALVENLMKKWMPKLRRARRAVLFGKIDSGRYGYDDTNRALDNLIKEDLIRVEVNPGDLSKRKDWILVWVGDGRKTKKWVETRGGTRPGAGNRPKKLLTGMDGDQEKPLAGASPLGGW